MRSIGLSLVLAAACAMPALAQRHDAAPIAVVDVRTGALRLGTDAATAADLSLATTRQPAAGWAGAVDVHAYPLRGRTVAIGLGLEAWLGRSLALNTEPSEDPRGPAILTRRLNGWSGVVSVNVGGRDTWGYLLGGAGPMRFQTLSSAVPHTTAPTQVTPEAGGGLRWFRTSHVGAVLDVHLYMSPAQAGTATTVGRSRKTVVLVSVGLSVR